MSSADLLTPGPLGDEVQGAANAPVTLIEYASMTCPHCASFHETTYPEMKKKYIDTGKIRFIFREFPLDTLAMAGSMLARCAGKEKFFPLIETLFAQQKEWVTQKPMQPLLAIARQAGFTQQSFEECLANQQVQNGIEEGRQRAVQRLNVQSTPTFFINGKLFRGTLTIAGAGQGNGALSQGLIRVFSIRRVPARRPPARRRGCGRRFGCGQRLLSVAESPPAIHSPDRCGIPTSTHPLGPSPDRFRQGRPVAIGTTPA